LTQVVVYGERIGLPGAAVQRQRGMQVQRATDRIRRLRALPEELLGELHVSAVTIKIKEIARRARA
jgi:hypothetical protein